LTEWLSFMIDNLKAVIFDIDDTLFDREQAQRQIVRLIARELRDVFAGIDEETVIDAFLESDRVALHEYYSSSIGSGDSVRTGRSKAFLRILGLDEDCADRITTMYVQQYPAINVPVEGAKSVVENIAGRFPLGVVSNGLPDVQYQKLRTIGLEHFFRCILLSEEIGIRKPDPRIFWQASGLLNKKPDECLYVGDSYHADVVGARNAGMKACWFNPHGLLISRVSSRPDFEISALDEILTILS